MSENLSGKDEILFDELAAECIMLRERVKELEGDLIEERSSRSLATSVTNSKLRADVTQLRSTIDTILFSSRVFHDCTNRQQLVAELTDMLHKFLGYENMEVCVLISENILENKSIVLNDAEVYGRVQFPIKHCRELNKLLSLRPSAVVRLVKPQIIELKNYFPDIQSGAVLKLEFKGAVIGYVLLVLDVEDSFNAQILEALSEIFSIALYTNTITDALYNIYEQTFQKSITDNFGLGNKQKFVADLEKVNIESNNVLLIYADLDDFKQVNDTQGHAFGDAVLQSVSDYINSALVQFKNTAHAYRIGGDEFAIVFTDYASYASSIENFLYSLEKMRTNKIDIKLSIGGCISIDVHSAEELQKKADASLYESKGLKGKQESRIVIL